MPLCPRHDCGTDGAPWVWRLFLLEFRGILLSETNLTVLIRPGQKLRSDGLPVTSSQKATIVHQIWKRVGNRI